MNKLLLLILITFTFNIGNVGSAKAMILDFESATPDTFIDSDILSTDYRVQLLYGHYDIFRLDDNNALGFDVYPPLPGAYSAVRIDLYGALFDLISFDVLHGLPGITGEYGLEANFVLQTSNSAIFGYDSIGTKTYSGINWMDLSYIDFITYSPDVISLIDNIHINRIPLPATLLLVVSGLAGIVLMKRYHKN